MKGGIGNRWERHQLVANINHTDFERMGGTEEGTKGEASNTNWDS